MTYLILGTSIVFKNIIGKKKTYILSIFTILLYILITGFSASIYRAAIMGIVMLISKIIYRKKRCVDLNWNIFNCIANI